MSNSEDKLKLSDLIDINLLQKLQDNFAKAVDVSGLMVDDNGPITKPSNFSDFCMNFIKSNETGSKRCNECNMEAGKIAAKDGEPIIYNCHTGLAHFVVPIIVNGQHIASILGGQFLLEEPNEEHFKNIAKQLGIVNEDEYLRALRKIKIHSKEHIKYATELLSNMGNIISEIAHQNLELINKNKKEQFYRKIIDVIRSSLVIEETLAFICEETAKFFNVQRTSISEVPKIEEGNKPFIRMEFKTNVEMDGVEKLANFSELANYYSKILESGKILAINNILELDVPDSFKESYNLLGVKSLLAIPIQREDDKWGILILSEYNNYRDWTEEDIKLANSIASQIYVAIKHAELYEQEKNRSAKEIALRETIKIIRSSLDTEKIKQSFLEVTCNYFGADRCIFDEYDKETNKFLPFKMEILKDIEVPSLMNFSVEDDFPEFADKLRNKRRNIIIKDVEKTLSRKKLLKYKAIQTLYNSDAKSDYGFLVQYKDKIMGILILHYIKNKRIFTYEELEFLKVLRDQAGIALHQAELYEKSKKQAEKEFLLRRITEKIRSSLDIDETLGIITYETANLFNVDRIAIIEFPDKNSLKNHIIRKEYKVTENIRSPQEMENYFDVDAFIAGYIINSEKPLIINNINESDFNGEIVNFYKSLDVKSLVWMPIISKENELWGFMTLSAVKDYKIWGNEDVSFLNSISNQIYIAISQAEIYEKERKSAQKEALIRNITERIRSSLDIEETLSFICEETAKLFNVQRTAITSFPHPETYEIFTVRKEYKASEDMVGFGFAKDSPKTVAYWADILIKENQVLVIDNMQNSDVPDYFKNTYNEMGVKSLMGTSIRRGEDVWGSLVLSEYNYYRIWTEDEKNLLQIIADQIYIAINQAELFEIATKKAQNEKALREIILASVQNFDMKNKIKSLVTEAGKLFEADRCFLIEVDTETNTNKPVQDYAEYLSSPDIISYITRPPSKDETNNFIQCTREKKYEYSVDVNTSPIPDATKKMLVDDLGVKSYLIAPVFYGDICYGAFVFHYVHSYRQFTQDEIDMAIAVASQSAVILHQAELFELTKLQAEREKISKNIIEILRSTLDKSIIRRLFVKNIGQFLNADRVMFSGFNQETQMYNPVSTDSEYLSNPDIKSFVGYDWSAPEAQEYIQPILEKREFHIYNWHEYIQGTFKSQDFINLLESMGIKSSYSFPVMYQQRTIGFFSIGFVQKVRRLSDEDINRIRNICTQAGIALYHAELYEEAQKSVQKHDEFVNKLSTELKDPLSMIVDFSAMESEHEIECVEEIEHLNKINVNAKQLLSFLDGIAENIKAKLEID